MCAPDPNAGIRMQAKIENQKKWSQYHRDSLKYWNREVSHRRGIERIATGLSRAKSDAYVKSLYALGRGRLASQEYAKEISTILHVNNIKAPVLVLHGSNDYVVPVFYSRDLISKLKSNNVNTVNTVMDSMDT